MKIVEIIKEHKIGLTDGIYHLNQDQEQYLNVFTDSGYRQVKLKDVCFIDWLDDLTKDELKQYKKLKRRIQMNRSERLQIIAQHLNGLCSDAELNTGYEYSIDVNKNIKFIESIILNDEIRNKIFQLNFINENNPLHKKEMKKLELLLKHSNYDINVIDLILDLMCNDIRFDEYESRCDSYNDLIDDIEQSDEFIVIFDDSDGERIWYKKAENLEIVRWLIKNEHRKTIGCGCNQYIDMIIKNGKCDNFYEMIN